MISLTTKTNYTPTSHFDSRAGSSVRQSVWLLTRRPRVQFPSGPSLHRNTPVALTYQFRQR